MTAMEYNSQIFTTYNDMELSGFSVLPDFPESIPDIPQADATSLNSLFSDFQSFQSPGMDYLLPLSNCDYIDMDNLTTLQPTPASSYDDVLVASGNRSSSSPMDSNSWQAGPGAITNSREGPQQTISVNGKKRRSRGPIRPIIMAGIEPEYGDNAPSRAETTGSKPKRRRVQNARQRQDANVRERKRMGNLNEAFDNLKPRLPTFASEKRLSRIETIRLATKYISFLTNILTGTEAGANEHTRALEASTPNSIDISFTQDELEALQMGFASAYSSDDVDSFDSGHFSS